MAPTLRQTAHLCARPWSNSLSSAVMLKKTTSRVRPPLRYMLLPSAKLVDLTVDSLEVGVGLRSTQQ